MTTIAWSNIHSVTLFTTIDSIYISEIFILINDGYARPANNIKGTPLFSKTLLVSSACRRTRAQQIHNTQPD